MIERYQSSLAVLSDSTEPGTSSDTLVDDMHGKKTGKKAGTNKKSKAKGFPAAVESTSSMHTVTEEDQREEFLKILLSKTGVMLMRLVRRLVFDHARADQDARLSGPRGHHIGRGDNARVNAATVVEATMEFISSRSGRTTKSRIPV